VRSERRSRRRAGWLAILALLLLAGVVRTSVGTTQPRPAEPAEPAQTFPETDAPFPSDTASDVVSYADHVALVTAVAEAEEPQTAVATPTGSSLPAIPRRVTFRIDRLLWSRPDGPGAPATVTARWCGWVITAGKRTPCATTGTPWVFVGGQYVMPIALDRGAFAPIQPFAVFRFNDGAVTLEEQDTPLARQLANAWLDRVAGVFANAVPDPVSVRYGHLSPRARLAAVMASRSLASRIRD
jgi:hypothetical protein